MHLDLSSKMEYDNQPYPANLRWWLPEGFTVEGKKALFIPRNDRHTGGVASADFVIKASENVEAQNRVVLEITSPGRHTSLYVPIVLLG